MLLKVPNVLSPDEVAHVRRSLDETEWVDGRATAGHQARQVKDNVQVAEDHPTARRLAGIVLAALQRSPLFMSFALPLKVYPPAFNRYAGGQTYGNHVDGAIRDVAGTPHRVRTDLSATLFLSQPDEYEGGELTVEDTYGVQRIKLPAGDMILYPATSLHRVSPVTSGARVGCFFWVQSMVRDDGERTILFDLDQAIQGFSLERPNHPSGVQLMSVYHNLLRRWAEL